MKETKLFEKAIDWAKKKGFSNIKANTEDYETPVKFSREGEDQAFIPDITATRLGSKNYVEIALKTDDTARRVSKWKLLSTLAAMKSGKLFLLAPKGHKAFTVDLIKKHHINATVESI